MTLEQAVRNAVAAELAAARFYRSLMNRAADDKARQFFAKMVEQEEEHASSIERVLVGREEGGLGGQPDANVSRIETVPGWRDVTSITLEDAIAIAIEAELSASMYYDAIADHCEGEVQTFFRDLSKTEESHAHSLRNFRREYN